MTVRLRAICTVQYGRFNEYLQVCHELDEIARARGWIVPTYWAPGFGTANEIIAEYEYPDYASMERESEAAQQDAEFMKVFRGAAELVYPQTARSEAIESLPSSIA